MPWLGTFHAIGVKILRRHAELAGLKSSFTILDTDDQIRLLKQVIQAENIDEKRWPARQLAAHIDRWKNRGLLPDKVPASDAVFVRNGRGAELYTAYQERLAVLNAVDFGDLLLKPIKLFTDHPDILADYHRRFKYILVDEYQDTNVAQYLWLRLLAQGTGDRSPTSAASAMTTSRSMAGAAPRWTTSCALSGFSRRRRSSGWSATTAPPRQYPGHCLASDCPQRGSPGQDAVHRCGRR
jgi:DNA helicase-2/ATP-dependent DNA helicase PcrA